MIAAIAVPRNVTAITSVASRIQVFTADVYAKKKLTTVAGTSISTRLHAGTCRLSVTSATFSGRIRSNAAAKITRVDDRKSVPDQPRYQAPNTTIRRPARNELWNHIPTSSGGYDHTGMGAFGM